MCEAGHRPGQLQEAEAFVLERDLDVLNNPHLTSQYDLQ